MTNKEVSIDSIITFLAWLKAKGVMFYRDMGTLDTEIDIDYNTVNIKIEMEELQHLLRDFQEDGYLPKDLNLSHMEKEIGFRVDDIEPGIFSRVVSKKKESWNDLPPFAEKWMDESKSKTTKITGGGW